MENTIHELKNNSNENEELEDIKLTDSQASDEETVVVVPDDIMAEQLNQAKEHYAQDFYGKSMNALVFHVIMKTLSKNEISTIITEFLNGALAETEKGMMEFYSTEKGKNNLIPFEKNFEAVNNAIYDVKKLLFNDFDLEKKIEIFRMN